MSKKVKVIEVTDSSFVNLACGNCYNVLYGYDEVFCPSCGTYNDIDNPQQMTQEQLFDLSD